eukprot:g6098.t1
MSLKQVGVVYLLHVFALFTGQTWASPKIYPGMNNVGGQIPEPRASTATIRYLGDTASVQACEKACLAMAGSACTSFTWHSAGFSAAEWASQCYGRTDGVWAPVPQDGIDSGRVHSLRCASDADCSFNGVCSAIDGTCTCDPQWRGDYCQRLNLLPAPRYGGKMDFDPKTGRNISSWGGAVMWDNSTNLWHMWSAEMADHCGIGAWLSNSVVAHSISKTLLGPYKRQATVFPAFAHEPSVARAPSGELVMFFTSTVWSGDPRHGAGAYDFTAGQAPVPGGNTAYCDKCVDGRTTGCAGGRNWSMALPTFMSSTSTPADSTSWSAPVAVPGVQLSPLIDTNMSPWILPNGSVLALWRNDDDRGSLHTATAADWRQPDSYVQAGDQSHPLEPGTEDPHIWRDAKGRFHCITHSFDNCGYHSFSEDGRHWRFAPGAGGGDAALCAFTYTVAFDDGTSHAFDRRERPHMVLGKDGATPVALSTSVTYRDDASYTLLQPVGQSQPQPEVQVSRIPARPPHRRSQAHLRARPLARARARARAGARKGTVGGAAVAACDETQGNEFDLTQGVRRATLSRTGLEGLSGFDDGRGNATRYSHDDFSLTLLLRGEHVTEHLRLGSAQDTDSRRPCALMAAGCAPGAAGHATFEYRCAATHIHTPGAVQVLVTYSLEAGAAFVQKALAACALSPVAPTGGVRRCDPSVNATVVSSTVWDGLLPSV